MALVRAAEEGDIQYIRNLLDHGADINTRDKKGYTALIIATQYKYIVIIRLLLDRGADPNISSVYGDTSLIYASFGGRTDIVRLLLRYGADPNIQNRYGETALDKAVQFEYDDIAELIQDHIDLQKTLQRTQQNLAFASSLNPRLGDDSVLRYLDYDTITKLMSYPRKYDPSISIRMKDEVRRDKLTKSLQRLASMRSMHSGEGPFRSIRYEPNIMRGISEYLSRMGPVPSVQERLMLEDRQTGSGRRRRSKSRRRRRKKYTRNRFY